MYGNVCTAEGKHEMCEKIVLKFESGHTPWSVDVSLKYALNNVTSDLVSVPGSAKTAKFDDGYTFEFENACAMTHLYVELSNPKNNGATGGFWPAIAEAEIYIDNGAEETVELENIAATRKQSLTLKSEVNASADKAKSPTTMRQRHLLFRRKPLQPAAVRPLQKLVLA